MKIFKHIYICPFCFTKNDLYKVEFRCENDSRRCPPEPDKKWSTHRGLTSPSMQQRIITLPPPKSKFDRIKSIFLPKEAVCPACGEKSQKRVCPECHTELPYTIADFKNYIFAIIGARESGKSHYISVLLNKIRNEIGMKFNCNLHPLNDDTINRYRKLFYDPVFRKKETIPATISALADRSVRIPLIYTLAFTGKNFFRRRKVKSAVNLVFFDTAGEDLNAEDIMKTENKYIYCSSGIILLLDPLQLSYVRANLSNSVALPMQNTETSDILARTINLIRKANNIKQPRQIDIPIALTFSKIDAVSLESGCSLNYDSKHDGRFSIEDFENVNAEMESMLEDWGEAGLVNQLRSNFKHYAFFGLSALGCNPHDDQKIKKFRPRRVEDPFLWLLWKLNIIKGKKES